MNPYTVVKDFEQALCDYTGAKYAVTVTSCTMALRLALRYWRWETCGHLSIGPKITVPSKTYISVPFQVIAAGCHIEFSNEDWDGLYKLTPSPVWDSARYFSGGMYRGIGKGGFGCLSFHWAKILGVGQGGCILHDNGDADEWFRKMRFDGRSERVAPKDDDFSWIKYPPEHCYMSPRDAADGLSRLAVLPKHNAPLPNDDYPDLSKMEVFK